MEQHHVALAAMFRRHQGRAVGQARPSLGRQFRRRFRENLRLDGDVARDRDAAERRALRKRRQRDRIAPRHGAAEAAPAGPQPHRQQRIDIAVERRPGEAHQHAAVLYPFRQSVLLGFEDAPAAGHEQHRERTAEKLIEIAGAHIGKRLERLAEIEAVFQQRRRDALGGRAGDAHGPALPARIRKHGGGGPWLAFDVEARDAVGEFCRQVE